MDPLIYGFYKLPSFFRAILWKGLCIQEILCMLSLENVVEVLQGFIFVYPEDLSDMMNGLY